MADEEDDYMSDKFLLDVPQNNPGLSSLLPRRFSRQHKKAEEHRESNERNRKKPVREREEEHREQGLSVAIDNSNVGFAMLQKMGYKRGMGLGKEGEHSLEGTNVHTLLEEPTVCVLQI